LVSSSSLALLAFASVIVIDGRQLLRCRWCILALLLLLLLSEDLNMGIIDAEVASTLTRHRCRAEDDHASDDAPLSDGEGEGEDEDE